MKKLLLGLCSIGILIAPITIAVSCGRLDLTDYDIDKINNIQDYTKSNKWIDAGMTRELEKRLAESKYSLGSSSQFSFHENTVDNKFKIKHKLLKNDLIPENIKEEFKFTDYDDTSFIENFISIYSKWNESDVIGYHDDSIKMTNKNIHNKKIWIESNGGPYGYMKTENVSVEGSAWKIASYLTSKDTTLKNIGHKTVFQSNVDVATFNQAQYGFNPSVILNTADPTLQKILLDRIKGNKGYANYENSLKSHSLSNYMAMKLMIGDIDLNLSRTLEILSESFMKISSVRKEYLIDHYKALGYNVILGGSSYGYEQNMSDIIINNDILSKVYSVSLGLNYLNKRLLGSLRASGGLLTRKMEGSHTFKGNNSTVDILLFFSTQYAKQKYGFITELNKIFLKPDYKKIFNDKVSIFIGGKDYNVGVISKYEKEFLIRNHIKFSINENEGHTLLSYPNKQWFADNVFKENLFLKTSPANFSPI